MPVTPTYPGVYIEEIPSGVRTITGVATSITAFIGRALRGPVNEPTTINSFADFERRFGGLWVDIPMSYAVRDFYLNGGSQAIIVRLFQPLFADEAARQAAFDTAAAEAQAAAEAVSDAAEGAVAGAADPQDVADAAEGAVDGAGAAGDSALMAATAVAQAAADAVTEQASPQDVADAAADAVADAVTAAANAAAPLAKARLTVDPLILEAAYEGSWGNALRARVDHNVSDELSWMGAYGLTEDDLFNLMVLDTGTGVTETFLNVTVKDSPRQIDRVLENASNLVRVFGDLPSDVPAAHDDPAPGKDPWADNDPATNSKVNAEASVSQPLATDDYTGSPADKTGMYALEKADLFNLLCIPPDARGGTTPPEVYQEAMRYCADRRAMLLVDSPANWGANKETAAATARDGLTGLGLSGVEARNAALYFPRVTQADPLRGGQLDTFVPCGIVAGLMARTDTQRGVWKAPAGVDASLNGIRGLEVNLTNEENGMLNPLGINCLRIFPIIGNIVWGARTLRGADQLADEYKYVPVRRLALFLEESLYRGTQWVVFEPNDEPLWAQVRLNIGAFMHNLFRQGAFQGTTPREAYFVKCDSETTTQNDINLGIVNIVVGFAPLKPAEFVILKIQQMTGQIEV